MEYTKVALSMFVATLVAGSASAVVGSVGSKAAGDQAAYSALNLKVKTLEAANTALLNEMKQIKTHLNAVQTCQNKQKFYQPGAAGVDADKCLGLDLTVETEEVAGKNTNFSCFNGSGNGYAPQCAVTKKLAAFFKPEDLKEPLSYIKLEYFVKRHDNWTANSIAKTSCTLFLNGAAFPSGKSDFIVGFGWDFGHPWPVYPKDFRMMTAPTNANADAFTGTTSHCKYNPDTKEITVTGAVTAGSGYVYPWVSNLKATGYRYKATVKK